MPELIIHPVTGLRALGMGKRGPIWPVIGGSEDAPPADPAADPAPADKGFPQGVPVADMAADEQAAYWKDKARKHENAVKSYGGKTAKEVSALEKQLAELQAEKLTDAEKVVAEAKAEAETSTRAALETEWRPKLQAAQLETIAARILDDEQMKSFMAIVDASKFVGADGNIDRDAVAGHLTAIYGKPREFGAGVPQHMNWGQNGTGAPAPSGAAAGRAEAQKRFGKKPDQ